MSKSRRSPDYGSSGNVQGVEILKTFIYLRHSNIDIGGWRDDENE